MVSLTAAVECFWWTDLWWHNVLIYFCSSETF